MSEFDVILLDLDGVVYIGPEPAPGAVEAITEVVSRGVRCCYVTNNASRTPAQVAQHLRSFGLPAADDDVVTSSQAGAALMRGFVPSGEVLAVGGEGVRVALAEQGFDPVTHFSERTVAVMQGYGPEVGWADLAEATFAVRAGLPWVATNLDRTFPTPRGAAPGNGALVQLVAETAGRAPDAVAGKPEPALLQEALRRTGARRPLMVGDRLDTDIAAASRLGIPSLLVLTGICNEADARAAQGDEVGTYIAADLGALLPGGRLAAWPGPAAGSR